MSAPINMSLKGRTAMVTGGGSGLGFQYSEAFAHAGANLVLVGRTEKTLASTAEQLPGDHRIIVGDLMSDEVYAEIAEIAGEIDILLNNAGGDIRKNRWMDQTPDDWRATYEINVVAAMRLAQLVAPGMIERSWGRIINVSSVYGFLAQNPKFTQPDKDAAAYMAAKHGVIGLTHFLAGRLAEHGITVNTISPGMFPLDPDDPALADKPWKRPTPGGRERIMEATPLKRVGGKRDLGAAALFLASPDASFVTGQNIPVDGGWGIW